MTAPDKCGMTTAQSWPKVGPKSPKVSPKVGPKWAQSRSKVKSQPKVGQKSAKSRPKVGPKSAKSRPKVGQKSVLIGPKTRQAPIKNYANLVVGVGARGFFEVQIMSTFSVIRFSEQVNLEPTQSFGRESNSENTQVSAIREG